jgi:hypothetical protein
MSATYEITSQKLVQERQEDGTYLPMVEVAFTVNTTPPTQATITVPKALLADKVAFVEDVKAQVEKVAAAHHAVAAL